MADDDPFWGLWEQELDADALQRERAWHVRNRVWGSITVALVAFWVLVIWVVVAHA